MRTRDLVLNTIVVVVIILLVIGFVRLLTHTLEILILILISAILAAGLGPVVQGLQRVNIRLSRRKAFRLSKVGAIAVVYITIILLLILAGGIVLTPLVTEARDFVLNLPQLLRNLEDYLQNLESRYTWLPDLSGIAADLPRQLGALPRVGAAAGVAFKFLGGIASIVTLLFMTFYMLLEGPQIKREFLAFFARDKQAQVEEILDHISLKFGGWLRGQIALGSIIGLAAGIAATAWGLPYPLLLALIAGITELIPIVGPILGGIPAVLIALFIPPWWRVVGVAASYILIQQLENNFVVPRVMRAAVGLSPLLTIIALLVGGRLLGIMGALLSVPVAAALQVVAGEIFNTLRREANRASTRS
jgi:predicted PurR-regulated permease PerM